MLHALQACVLLIANALQAGFEPATFKSSRSDRTGAKQQSIDDFLDEDELEERKRTHLHVKVRQGLKAESHLRFMCVLGSIPLTWSCRTTTTRLAPAPLRLHSPLLRCGTRGGQVGHS